MALLPLESSYEGQGESSFCEQTLSSIGKASGSATGASKVTRRSVPKRRSSVDAATSRGLLLQKEIVTQSKMMVSNLYQRYQSATCTKMYEVEELVDYYFHRRLAAFWAVIISYLPFVITPNQITLFGLVLGWASATCLYDAEFHTPLGWEPNQSLMAAGLLMFSWIVSDCADGQVARLCKRGTRTGRILDGVVDGAVLAPNLLVIGRVCLARFGEGYMVLAIFSGFSLWLHAIIYDKIKNVFMENSLPASECDGETVESVTAEYHAAKAKAPFSLDSVLLGIYVVYLTLQAKFTSDAASKAEVSRQNLLAKCDDNYRSMYMTRYRHIVRLASWMGISAHVVGLYLAYFAAMYDWNALVLVQLYFAVVLNLVMVASLFMYTRSGMMSASQPWGPDGSSIED